jgi:hypothetical protein
VSPHSFIRFTAHVPESVLSSPGHRRPIHRLPGSLRAGFWLHRASGSRSGGERDEGGWPREDGSKEAARVSEGDPGGSVPRSKAARAPRRRPNEAPAGVRGFRPGSDISWAPPLVPLPSCRLRAQLLSFLRNWPSTGSALSFAEHRIQRAPVPGKARSSLASRSCASARNSPSSRRRVSMLTSFFRFTLKSVSACARSFTACRFWLMTISGP